MNVVLVASGSSLNDVLSESGVTMESGGGIYLVRRYMKPDGAWDLAYQLVNR